MNVLTESMVRAGAELTRKLDEMRWPVFASLWFYLPEGKEWQLVLASPKASLDGPKQSYETIQSALSRVPSAGALSLSDIAVTDPNNQLILQLRSAISTGPTISGIRFRQNLVNGVFIEDAYIYRNSDRAPGDLQDQGVSMFRWQASFLLPGLQVAQPLTLGTIHIDPSPRTEDGQSQSSGHLSFGTERYLRDSEAKAKALSQLEPLAVAAAAIGGSVGEPVITSVRLENRQTLEASGVSTPLADSGLLVQWNVLAPDIDSATLAKGYRAALTLGPEEAPRWHRAARWLWKANLDADPYDQFLALWIAFNVLYGRKWRGNEADAITEYLAEELPQESEAQKLLAGLMEDLRKLGASGLTLRRDGSGPVADQLQTALGLPETTRSSRELLRLVSLVIYSLRCDIVHAGGVSVARGDTHLLWASRDVLKTVVMYLLRRRLGVEGGGV